MATRSARRPPAAALLALAGCVALAGCAREPRRPNLVLISLDTVRADHLGAYGYRRATSPALDRLAREGVVFERAYSTSNWTLTAHVSMLTGLWPDQHRVHRMREALAPGVELLPEALAPLGYTSAAVISAVPFLKAEHGLARGWRVYDDRTVYPEAHGPAPHHLYVSSPHLHRRALELLDQLDDGPFFLFLHYFDAHNEYLAPPPYDTMFSTERDVREGTRVPLELPAEHELQRPLAERQMARYDGEIRWIDEWLGKLFEELDRRGLADETLVLVVSDHGEEFLEHGALYHGRNLYDVQIRVPLIVRFPGRAHAGRRIATPVSLVDVGATLLGAAGRGRDEWRSGRDLAGLLASPPAAGFDARPLFATGLTRDAPLRRAIVVDGLKAIFRATPDGGLGRLVTIRRVDGDPLERTVVRSRGRVPTKLRRRFLAALEEQRRTAVPPARRLEASTAEDEAVLRALGYL
jgi:arylsulfatase A-like enzyme